MLHLCAHFTAADFVHRLSAFKVRCYLLVWNQRGMIHFHQVPCQNRCGFQGSLASQCRLTHARNLTTDTLKSQVPIKIPKHGVHVPNSEPFLVSPCWVVHGVERLDRILLTRNTRVASAHPDRAEPCKYSTQVMSSSRRILSLHRYCPCSCCNKPCCSSGCW